MDGEVKMNKIASKIRGIIRSDEAIVFIFSLTVGCLFAYYSYSSGLMFGHLDANAHLILARKVVDSLTPGISQMIGSWLPFVHVSMLPFIWNDFLWCTGLAGTIPSLIYFAITSVFLYKLAFRYFEDKQISYLTVFIFICNPYSLYFASNPMFEMPFMMTLILSTYYFYRWLETSKLVHLSICSFFIALSTLTWYPGWALPLVFLFLLIMKLWIDRCDWKKLKAHIAVYCIGAFSGIVLWLLLNWMIYGNPFNFLMNEFSVPSQAQRTFVPTKDDFLRVVVTVGYATIYIVGAPLLIFSIAGGLVTIFHRRDFKTLSLFALSSPGIFFTTMLFIGYSIILVPEIDKKCFNIRYFLTLLPFIALFIASFYHQVKKHTKFIFCIFCILLIVVFTSLNTKNIYDGDFIVVKGDLARQTKGNLVVDKLLEIYDNGTILCPVGAYEPLILVDFVRKKHIPFRKVIHYSNSQYYENASREPWNYSKWVLIIHNVPVQPMPEKPSTRWKDSKLFHKLYHTEYMDRHIEILKLNESALPYLGIYQQPGYFEIEDVTLHGYLHFTISNFDDFQHSVNISIKCNESQNFNTSVYYVMPNSDRAINIKMSEECYTCENITLVVEGEKYMVEKIFKNNGFEIRYF